ncbi:zinc finger protein 708-like [Contarinia nasturtii]|uniref:zinc finger protein 708-like n=1 Tax=Contarinia nasturtii TaxID=265458 RepID=UPI0012D3FFB5|nr:zinc finger protein 708-like [Contarinia nasturtii]
MTYFKQEDDPLAVEEHDWAKLLAGTKNITCEKIVPTLSEKRCPDCFTVYSTQYSHHCRYQCNPNRKTSIDKVSDLTQQSDTEIMQRRSENVDSDYVLARIKVYSCEGCGFKFKNTYNLKRHKQTCKSYLSGKMLGSADVVVQEELIKALKYHCDRCGMVFNRLFNVKRHQNSRGCKGRPNDETANNARHFKCIDCQKLLVSKESHRNHKLKYCPAITSSKPKRLLTCKGCGTSFTKSYNLNRHQTNNCPALKVLSKDSVCYICSKTFTTFELLNEHLQKIHKTD